VLRCLAPAMVRKEFWAHLLARAAHDLGALPRELSFKGALQAFAERLLEADHARVEELYQWLHLVVACHQVGDRPDRVEPRAQKRRPKHYTFLSKPREQARAELLQGVTS
jgi:hypothetical protein